jgi:hypothetical protein
LKSPLKSVLLFSLVLIHGVLSAGDPGKAPIDKAPLTPHDLCVDPGGSIGMGFHSDYVYKGYLLGEEAVSASVHYTFDGLSVPVTLGIDYVNVVSGVASNNIVNDDLAVSVEAGLPAFAGIESSLGYTHHFYPEDPNTPFWPSSHGEVGLHLARDFGLAVLKFDLAYNTGLPNAWNGTLPAPPNGDSGAWFWDLGLERSFEVFGQDLVLAGGVAYADNYWGSAPTFQTGGRSSGWNHYYLTASLPIQLNCRTVLTPYLGYVGAPDSWLLDGAPNWNGNSGQSDLLHGGVTLSVSF